MDEPVYTDLADVPDDDLDGDPIEYEGDDTAREEGNFGELAFLMGAPPKKPGAKVVPFRRELRVGKRGQDVIAVKRALSAAKCMKWGKFSPIAGPFFGKAVRRFQRKHGLHVDGVYGPATHRKLARFFDNYALKYLWKARADQNRPTAVRQRIVADAYLGYRNRDQMDYSQGPSRMIGLGIPFPKVIPVADCSAWLTCLYKRAGSKVNPNGYSGWPPYGFTGTLRSHGMRVLGEPELAADVHYGPGTGRHVSIYVGGGKQIGHGSWRGPTLGSVHYRSDFDHYRDHLG